MKITLIGPESINPEVIDVEATGDLPYGEASALAADGRRFIRDPGDGLWYDDEDNAWGVGHPR